MSYCRIDKDSAIYLIKSRYGWECVACRMCPDSSGFMNALIISPKDLRKHLKRHQDIGQLVPKRVFDRLKREGH